MIFETNQKVLFMGDSVTDAGRRPASVYGDGYVSQVHSLLLARYPELRLRIVNRGVGGDTTRDLAARWERDVIDEQPDWLSLMIGINDVWRAFGPHTHEATPLPEYERNLRTLLGRVRSATGARLILMTPYLIEPDRRQPMRRQMDLYGQVMRALAAELDAPLVDTQAAFDTGLSASKPTDWSDDQIHPNRPGHAVIALALLRAIGFEL